MTLNAATLRARLASLDARLLRVVATAGATYLGRFGSGIAVLITLPMARHTLDPELFGVWMMLSALLGFMAFADLGIGNGVLNKTTQAKASGDGVQLRRVLVSGYVCTGLVGLMLYLVWLIWSYLSAEPTILAGSITEANRAQVRQALGTFAAILAINIPASLIQRVQLGMQQGYWTGISQFVSALLLLIAVPLALKSGGGVTALVLATLGIQAMVNIANAGIWLYWNDMFSAGWKDTLHWGTMVGLLRTGGLFFILQMAAAFAFQSDSIVITQTLGQHAYGDFAVIQKLFFFVSMILSAAMVGLWPAFGDAIARNNTAWAVRVLQRTMIGAGIVALLATMVLSAGMPWMMTHWLHVSWTPSWGLLAALSTWTVIDAVTAATAAFMNGANMLRIQVIFALVMSSTAFGLKWLLTPMLGTTGSVLATIVAYSIISIPGQIYVFRRVFKTKD
ncbi:lipopolysaccharide biosynthesis protein [Pelomonas sp. KK5]|uniref:lipopolysaccharide biosynthesis protein n=1 Tax=Pelomonas sp. KK5 TaxID=1855730 RepID=UPI00097BE121|nr:oligosaccharide flippase family protein [Pelomonas sp. KK5]